MGVEASGHHFFGLLEGGDDGLFTSLVVLGLIARSGLSLAGLIERFVWPSITPDLRIPWEGDAAATLQQIAETCRGEVSRLDGVRAEYSEGWALARASITEPAITLRFEGDTTQRVRAIAADFLAGVPHLRERVMKMLDE